VIVKRGECSQALADLEAPGVAGAGDPITDAHLLLSMQVSLMKHTALARYRDCAYLFLNSVLACGLTFH